MRVGNIASKVLSDNPELVRRTVPANHFRVRLVFFLLAAAGSWPVRAEPYTPRNFENDIIPILTRFGCNTSGCHGKAEGQNGFKLSVFGFDPETDYEAIVHEGRGRRVFPASPTASLLLRKACGDVPHGGGVRIDRERPEYARLRDWIAVGMPFGSADDPVIERIAVEPRERQLAMGDRQPLRVTAYWSDGRTEDVTATATYQSNNEALAAVDENGLVAIGQTPGAVAVMASYLGKVDVFQALIPRGEMTAVAELEPAPVGSSGASHRIDELVVRRLAKLNIAPSSMCDDATFLRRVYLDVIGTLPTADEARRFLADEGPDRRQRVVDELLERPEFADYWALKWSDLLRVNRRVLGREGAYTYYRWIHDSFVANKPLDQFARELLTAEGPLSESPAGQFYKVVPKPNEMASTVSQVFLGVRIECAQCHHHPWDRWGQKDYFGMQAFFTQVKFKSSPLGEMLTSNGNAATKHPRTGQTVFAHSLGEPEPEVTPEGDRRERLADWLVAGDNPWFARSMANRTWAHFLGRGLVEPVDDFRLTNPPTNPELLDALAQQLVDSGYDFRQLIRTIVATRTYQRATGPNESNARDEQNYSRFPMKRMDAEVLFDAVCQTTGVPEKFVGLPGTRRAIQLWDSQSSHYFLTLFGRPVRETACECERVVEPTVGQTLHVLNSPDIHNKLRHAGGRIGRLERDLPDNVELVEELYLTFFGRQPTADERTPLVAHLTISANRREAAEDIAWSLMNSLEFLFNH